MIYGGTVPTFTAAYNGFVNGDTSSVLSGSPSLTTTATSASPAGTYTITAAAGTLAAANYTFTFVNGTLTINNPLPTVTSLSPSSATAGGAAFTLTVTGTNFVSTSTVQWNGTGLTTTYVSGTELTGSVPASDIATAGTASVTVMNLSPGGGTSSGLTFTTNKPPLVSLSAPGLSYGIQPLSTTSATQTETITNIGTGNLTISTVTIGGTNASEFAKSADTCTRATVIPNGTCAVSVTFTPSGTGSRTATLSFNDNAVNSPQTVSLSGMGTAVSLSPRSLSFGAHLVGRSSLETVTLTNLSSTPLSIASLAVVSIAPLTPPGMKAEDFVIQSSTCVAGGSVAGLGNCTINLAFKPTSAGVQSATLVIADSDPGSPQTVNLRGTGTAVRLSATSLSFGPQPVDTTSAPKTVTLLNLGATPLRIENLTLRGTDAGDFAIQSSSTCVAGGSVAGLGSCTVNLAFKPTAVGARSATLAIGDSDPSSPQTVSLSGRGM
jgi:hypothetical protein